VKIHPKLFEFLRKTDRETNEDEYITLAKSGGGNQSV